MLPGDPDLSGQPSAPKADALPELSRRDALLVRYAPNFRLKLKAKNLKLVSEIRTE